MKLADVERNIIIDLGDGRLAYTGDRNGYKATETRTVFFREEGELKIAEFQNDTEVTIVAVPETLIWRYLDAERTRKENKNFETFNKFLKNE